MTDHPVERALGAETFARLRARLRETNALIRERGIREYEGRRLVTGYSSREFYDWDLYFENLYLAAFGVAEFCRSNLEAFLARQLVNGFTARTLLKIRPYQQFKPFLAQIALLYCRQTGEWSWPDGALWERLVRYLDYWFWYCDFDKNGLAVWDSADHSGMDNQIRRAGAYGEQRVEGVDLNCYLLRELEAMAILAERRGDAPAAENYRAHARGLRGTVGRVFWDDGAGFFFDRDERSGERIRVKSAAGFIPLWTGAASPEQAERLVKEHLANPAEFWLAWPVASWAADEPDYGQELHDWGCNWRGTTWIPVNYMLMHGLIRYGFRELAETLARRSLELVLKNPATREYYNAETGAGLGLDPFWGWSNLGCLMLPELLLGLDPTDQERPFPAGWAAGLFELPFTEEKP